MRKLLCMLLAFKITCLCPGLALAGENQSNQEGQLTLTDSGDRPGVPSIQVAWKTVVAYTGKGTAAGYGGTDGQVMCCVSGHPDAHPFDALYFAVRASHMVDQIAFPDDNMLYQISAGGTYCNVEQCVSYLTVDIANTWHPRPQ